MKKISAIYFAGVCLAIIILAAGGCRKMPINGKLDGQWQIMKIENLQDGSDVTSVYRSYIDISLHVVNLRNVSLDESAGSVISGNMKYDKGGNTLYMDFPYNTEGSKLDQLQLWGIYSNPVTFDIVKLDGKQLILKSPETLITCRRY